MSDLLKLAGGLALFFAATFFLFEATELVTAERIRFAVDSVRSIHPVLLWSLVMLLLVLDLFIAVPTMTTILIAGFVMGTLQGGAASALGLIALGLIGYAIGRVWGRPALMRLWNDEARVARIESAFRRSDLLVLACCQALPILPEVSACLAGVSRLSVRRFLTGYSVGVVPYAFIVARGGAMSSTSDLSPAIYTAIGVTAGLLIAWSALLRLSRRP